VTVNTFATLYSKNPTKYQHIRMISEGSCDTEDWSNEAENPVLPSHHNKLYLAFLNKLLFEI